MKKGDKVRVRLETGDVVEAVYDERAALENNHWVIYKGDCLQTVGKTIDLFGGVMYGRCRFVGPCAVAVPSEVRE